jgi:predicted small integral membrane protein
MPHMTKLILMAVVVAVILAVLNLAWGPTRPAFASPRQTLPPLPAKKVDRMPVTFQTIAYVLLIILMLGVATGWVGAA